jgi:mRNA-capping enzyme
MDGRSLKEVPFAGGVAYEVVDESTKQQLALALYGLWQIPVRPGHALRFPGPNPVSVESKHVDWIRDSVYVAGEKTDGERYLLMMLEFDGKQLACLVNRKMEFFVVSGWSPATECFRGTLVDAEMVKTGTVFTLMIFDLICLCGEYHAQRSFDDRYEQQKRFLRMVGHPALFCVTIKCWYSLQQLGDLKKVIQMPQSKTDGVIFMPTRLPVKTWRHDELLKWKPAHLVTIDFRVVRGEERSIYEFKLYDTAAKQDVIAQNNFGMEDCVLKALMDYEIGQKGSAIVECGFMWDSSLRGVEGMWVPRKVRMDKSFPNNVTTFHNTRKTIRDNVTLEAIAEAAGHPMV